MKSNTGEHAMHKKANPAPETPGKSSVEQLTLADPPASFYKPDQAHAIIGIHQISRRSFYNALKRGEIPNIRLGKRILIPRHAFNLWLEGKGIAACGSTALRRSPQMNCPCAARAEMISLPSRFPRRL
jgi:excisionase family DNA binding protein